MSYGDRSSDVCSSDLSSGKRETLPDGFLFFPTTRRATENVSFLALRNGYLLYFHFGPHPRPVLFHQFRFKPLHLPAGCAHQILPAALADRRQVFLTHDTPIEYPDPARLPIFALHHAQDGFHRRDVGAVAVERLIAERKTFAVDDQGDDHLLAVGTMVARIASPHHRLVLCRSFHIGARQIVEQHIELRSK